MHENTHKYFAKHCQFQYTILKENSKVRSALTSLRVSHYIRIYTSGIPKPKISDFAFFFEDNNEKRNIHMNKCMFMYMTFLQDQIFSTANLTVIY